MTEDHFAALFDWLADRRGQRLMIEAGLDEGEVGRPQLLFPLSIHATIAEVKRKDGVGPGLTVGLQDTAGDKDRLWLDPERITRVEFLTPGAVRVWLGDSCFIGLAGGRAPA